MIPCCVSDGAQQRNSACATEYVHSFAASTALGSHKEEPFILEHSLQPHAHAHKASIALREGRRGTLLSESNGQQLL